VTGERGNRLGPATASESRSLDLEHASDELDASTGACASSESTRVRLRTLEAGERVNPYLQGGWWPRSTDLLHELPELLELVRAAGFDAYRVVYRPSAWDQPARTADSSNLAGAHRIVLDSYQRQPTDTIALVDKSGSERLELLVIPPDIDAHLAGRALAIAGRNGDPDPAAEVLNRAAVMP